ncbi:3-ketoacyl-CoA thiolase [Mycolicibacterium tokaiense]|uniref:3-ketoacyl-CoA thiolase n=1 Tax=Mycolicibacterium tokaiense TaxID=39695 RepID=A0A378TD41_9MYCO|nr:3-ketoacyl-CoA thiolase [Mycolicibacterium tokaiense]
MNEVVIVAAARTAIGRGHPVKGMFRDASPHELLATAYHGVLDQCGITGSDVDEVLAGCVQQIGPQGTNIARNACYMRDWTFRYRPAPSTPSAALRSRRSIWPRR